MLSYSVQDAIRSIAALRPGNCAFIHSGVNVNYRQLVDDIDHVCRYVMAHDVSAGDRVAIVMPHTYLHILLILALDRLGATSISVRAGGEEINAPWFQSLDLDCIIASVGKPDVAPENFIELDPLATPKTLELEPEVANADIPYDNDPTRVVRLVSSSGTTGTPKIVALSRDMVAKRVSAHHLYCEGMGSNRYLLAMPLGTIAGYGWLLMVLCRGATAITSLSEEAIPHLIGAFQVSHLLLTPLHFRRVVEIGETLGCSFDSICMTTTGGAPFDVSLIERSQVMFGPNIWNGYASTEAGSIARGHISNIKANPTLIGVVLPFATVEVVDEEENLLPPNETGVIRIASDLVVDGYENDPGSENVFRDGFFYPGDLGSLDEHGRLFIEGRIDGQVNLRGLKVMPEVIEQRLNGLEDIRESTVFEANAGKGLKVYAAIVPNRDLKATELSATIRDALGVFAPQSIYLVEDLPRNNMGKIERQALKENFLRP